MIRATNKILSISMICVLSSAAFSHEGHHETYLSPTTISGESIYNLSSKWTNQDGKSVALSEFQGKAFITAMVYTSCTNSCALIVDDMKKIANDLKEKKPQAEFSYVLFSLDPERDTPEKLKTFAEKRNLNLKNWSLLQGSPKTIRKLAAVLGVRYKRDSKGDFDHSNVISFVDATGIVRYQQVGLNQNPKNFLEQIVDSK